MLILTEWSVIEMTYREEFRALIEDAYLDEGVSQEQINTILLTSIATSLAIIVDALTYRKDDSDDNDD